jgi:hypothetical protein
MKEFKILKVWSSSKVLFDQLTKKHKKKNAELFDEFVHYMKGKKNLLSLEKEAKEDKKIEKVITKDCNRVIGFIKHQEGEYLKPLLEISRLLLESEVNDASKIKEKLKDDSIDLESYKKKVSVVKEELLSHFSKYKKVRNFLGKESYELDHFEVKDVVRLKELLEEI